MVHLYLTSYLTKELKSGSLFEKNICLAAIKCFLVSALLFAEDKTKVFEDNLQAILNTFYPLLRIQFLYALYWRKNSGRLRSPPFGTLEELSEF